MSTVYQRPAGINSQVVTGCLGIDGIVLGTFIAQPILEGRGHIALQKGYAPIRLAG